MCVLDIYYVYMGLFRQKWSKTHRHVVFLQALLIFSFDIQLISVLIKQSLLYWSKENTGKEAMKIFEAISLPDFCSAVWTSVLVLLWRKGLLCLKCVVVHSGLYCRLMRLNRSTSLTTTQIHCYYDSSDSLYSLFQKCFCTVPKHAYQFVCRCVFYVWKVCVSVCWRKFTMMCLLYVIVWDFTLVTVA